MGDMFSSVTKEQSPPLTLTFGYLLLIAEGFVWLARLALHRSFHTGLPSLHQEIIVILKQQRTIPAWSQSRTQHLCFRVDLSVGLPRDGRPFLPECSV